MIVMKFGGASLSDHKNITQTCKIVRDYQSGNELVLIVSAMKGVTDALYEVVEALRQKKLKRALKLIEDLRKLHLSTLDSVSARQAAIKAKIELTQVMNHLEHFVRNVAKKEITLAREDYLVSYGERLSCRIVAEALEESGIAAYPIDASAFLMTNDDFGNAVPLYSESREYLETIILPLIANGVIPVVTGYIGFTHDGCTTTLGRGGSDLSAAFMTNFLDASGLYLWKDVPGFFDKDPHRYNDARILDVLTYNEAEKMAKAGAKVIYHKAIDPVRKKNIPIRVKSFIEPEAQGSIIEG